MKAIFLAMSLLSSVYCLGQRYTAVIVGNNTPSVGSPQSLEYYELAWLDEDGNPVDPADFPPESPPGEAIEWYSDVGVITDSNESSCNIYFPDNQSGTIYCHYQVYVDGANVYETSIYVTPFYPPAVFTVTGGGVKCDGKNVAVGLSGSEYGVDYQLYLNYAPVAPLMAGTGGPLSWPGNTDVGSYTIRAEISGCPSCSGAQMTGSATISQLSQPVVSPGGPIFLCKNESITLTRTTPQSGVTYNWRLNGTDISGATSQTYDVSSAPGDFTYDVHGSKEGCHIYSNAVQVQGLVKPVVSPEGPVLLCEGSSVSLTRTPSQSGVTYNWRLNGLNVSGATGQNHQISPVGVGDFAYDVSASRDGCSVYSNPVQIQGFKKPLASYTADKSLQLCSGDDVTLTATDNGDFFYAWKNVSTGLVVGIEKTFTISSATISTSENYVLEVANATFTSCETSSAVIPVTVTAIPIATISPVGNTTVCTGTVTLQANTGPGYLYEWSRNGYPIPGAVSASYDASMTGEYRVTITHNGCSSQPSAPVSVQVADIQRDVVAAGPTSFCDGSSTTLIAYYDEGYTYQWRKDGVNIVDAIQPQFDASVAGSYTVSISRYGCNAISEAVTISTSPAPVAVVSPSGPIELCEGENAALTGSTGSGYSHQWLRNGSVLAGATSPNYSATTSGLYTLMTTIAGCSTTSEGVEVVVNPLPDVEISASGPTAICDGEFITLQAFGTAQSYQWRNASGDISGEISSTLTTDAAGTYKVFVTDGSCSSESNSISITIKPLPLPVTDVSGSSTLSAGTKVLCNAVGPSDAESFVWNTPAGTNIVYDDPEQSAARLSFFELGEKTITVSAKKNGCLGVSFEKILTVSESVTGKPSEIPEELKVSPSRQQALAASASPPMPLNTISQDQVRDVFSGCIDGQYYVGFKLYYDLQADKNTSVNWTAVVDIDFMHGSTVEWTKSLQVDMATQTFISTIFHHDLISCDGTYQYRIKTKVTNVGGIQAPEQNIYLQALLFKKPSDVFDPSATFNSLEYSLTNSRITSHWDYPGKAVTSYDIEWVYIDEKEPFTGNAQEAFDFKEPVRVSRKASDNEYVHDVYYPNGKIWYRIRAVGMSPQYPSHRFPGAWYYGPGTALQISNHQQDKNWMVQTVFAEDGKYKKIMTYYDGTLRQRQALTNLSSEDLTLVGETLYDFEGRKAVDVLPVPSVDVSLKFKTDFNNFQTSDQQIIDRTSSTPPVQKKYHYDNGNVINSIMGDATGAANYYSATNLVNSVHKNYIPDADGYVYSQTEYLNDGTGRVSKQSGVGAMFAMDGGNVTRYFYTEASRTELVRLFGRNVGNASHYKKNVTVDANGQVSVSYVDQTGKVIATALAGDIRTEGTTPATLVDPLPSYTALPGTGVTIDLGSKNIISDSKVTVVHKILNEAFGTYYTFNYDFSSTASEIAQFGCFSCVYEVSIIITDPDGKPVALPAIAGNESGDNLSYLRKNLTATCAAGLLTSVQIDNLYFPEIGDYTIVKTLSVQEKTVEEIIAAIENDPDVIAEKQVISNSYAVDPEDCEICYSDEATCPDGKDEIDKAVVEIAEMDCENIRQGIIRKLEIAGVEPTEDAIENHPDYCAYKLCIADKDSDIFEKNLARIQNWDDAVLAGYDDLADVYNSPDPFFSNEDLSGYGYKDKMNSRLADITIAVVNGEEKGGSLAAVTNPFDSRYEVYGTDETTGQVVGPYHILYFNLMSKRFQMGETAYQKALKEQRWTLFRNFYLEAKRKLKINDITAYSSCDLALEKLQAYDYFPIDMQESQAVTEQRAIDWGASLGNLGISQNLDISEPELDMRMASLQTECNSSFTVADFDYIREELRAYFDSNNNNFLRLIFQQEVNVDQHLINVQNRLSTYGCSLEAVAVSDPITCAESTTPEQYGPNLVQNPHFPVSSGCSGPQLLEYVTPTGSIQTGCFVGWQAAWGSPIIKREGETSFELNGIDCSQDALLNTLSVPVEAGKKYMLKFSYRTSMSNPSLTKIELSPTASFGVQGGGTQQVFTESTSSNVESENMTMAVIPPSSPCESDPQPLSLSQQLWNSQFSLGSATFKQVQQVFTADQASQYLFFYHNQTYADKSTGIIIKDVELREIISSPAICYKYDPNNPTVQLWTYTTDWEAEIQRCNDRAQMEKDFLIGYAVDKYMDEQASIYNNLHKTNCLGNAQEQLRYNYTPKEYHYTLYYYDQAGNLVQTVPPAGVIPLDYTAANSASAPDPGHKLATRYEYTSVNQLLSQTTPDAGVSKFFYNRKGQLRFSRNAQQALDNKYSYTKYDAHGRIIETGEMTAGITPEVLVTYIDDPRFPDTDVPELPVVTLTDVTKTFYDHPNEDIAPQLVQEHLRGRVAWVEATDQTGPDKTATYYSYDIHGNVKALVQQVPGLDFKRTDYVYDLVSGNLNYVFYQNRRADQFIQKYIYDSDNRLTSVYSSSDAYLFNKEAEYSYYAHGPLARVELGEYGVQGQDYLYTLQGWIKGVNMPFAGDPGQDGISVARDVYAYTLGYYQGDYSPSGSGLVLPDTRDQMWTRFNELNGTSGLYNGNISWMVTDLAKLGDVNNDRAKGMQAMMYRYDQLNRIKRTYSLTGYTSGSGFGSRTASPAAYDESFTYDPNGNIKLLKRYNESGVLADDFDYQYYSNSNKLRQVTPLTETLTVTSGAVAPTDKFYRTISLSGSAYVPSGSTVELVASESIDLGPDFSVQSGASFTVRLWNDSEGVYMYDAIGNLVEDHEQKVSINWTPYGKVREVRNDADTVVVTFLYDGAGNRVYKKVVKPGSTITTHYARDASGNVMAVYSNTEVSEFNIYGSSRLGQYKGGVREGHQTLGNRNYELTNHLGNVLAVITDNVNMVGSDFNAIVAKSTDYYAFGLEMEGRKFTDEGVYRYGFNGKEKDGNGEFGDTSYDYGFRIYNPRVSRFLSVDPLTAKFPMLTPYQFASNTPIKSIDLDGLESLDVNSGQVDNTLSGDNLKTYQNNKDFKPWEDLIGFKPSAETFNSADKRVTALTPQPIERAYADELNLDYYSINITQLPSDFSSPSQFLNYVRTNFGKFTMGSGTEFGEYNDSELKIFNSDNPLSALMAFQVNIPFRNVDDLSVLTSKYESNYWVFTPVFTSRDLGHPVSGNRQFGITSNDNGSLTFFTRGADRPWGGVDAMLSSAVFEGADRLWSTVMSNLVNYINGNGGSAEVNLSISKRISWNLDYLNK